MKSVPNGSPVLYQATTEGTTQQDRKRGRVACILPFFVIIVFLFVLSFGAGDELGLVCAKYTRCHGA